jgi:hypothetical protein
MAISGKGEGKAKAAAKEIAPCGPHAIPAYISDPPRPALGGFLLAQDQMATNGVRLISK